MGNARMHLAAATAAATNRFVVSANMKVGAYALANAGAQPTEGARHVTVTHTQVGGVTDTLGTITVVGKDLAGNTITESITPLDGTIATGVKWFASVISVTGVGWVVDTTADTIVVGCTAAAIAVEGSGVLHGVAVNTTAAGAVTIADQAGTIAVLKASIAEGLYLFDVAFSGYLSITAAAASDLTVLHSGAGLPTSYALA
jgi:hypothetical protein